MKTQEQLQHYFDSDLYYYHVDGGNINDLTQDYYHTTCDDSEQYIATKNSVNVTGFTHISDPV